MADWDLKDVVVGYDGSEEAERAVDAAAGIASRHGARLHLVAVTYPPDRWWGVMGAPPVGDEVVEGMQRTQREMLSKAVAGRDLGEVETVEITELGHPATELTRYCEKVDAGLLVVGRRGAGMMERLLLGSVADRLAHHAPCPLLIVP
jgi:nucleotide-binding universal stress UspA family protein